MRSILTLIALAAILVAGPILMPAAALAADGTIVDLSPLLSVLVQFLAAILMVLLSWAAAKLAQKLGLEQDEKVRQLLDEVIRKGIAYGATQLEAKAGGAVRSVDLRSDLVAMAAEYVARGVPDALARFKVTPDRLADMVRARLPA